MLFRSGFQRSTSSSSWCSARRTPTGLPRPALLLCPRLSAVGDDAEVVSLGARACRRAACVERVVYVSVDAGRELCTVVAHDAEEAGRHSLAEAYPLEGLLEDVLGSGDVVLCDVRAGQPLGAAGSIERLAQRQVLGVPVGYGSGDKRVTLGALLLIDRASSAETMAGMFEDDLGSPEVQVAESFAAMIGAVLGARNVARYATAGCDAVVSLE